MERYEEEEVSHTYPEEPEDVILVLSQCTSVSVPGDCISKQPKTKSPSKYVNIFLWREESTPWDMGISCLANTHCTKRLLFNMS